MTTTGREADVETRRPIIATTMGDGAGVGPEIIVAALSDPHVVERSRPLVIGDAGRLREAARIMGADVEIVPVDTVADDRFAPGRIDVIDLVEHCVLCSSSAHRLSPSL